MELRLIKIIAIAGVALFPFVLFSGFWSPILFSKIIFSFTLIEFLLLVFLLQGLYIGEIFIRKSAVYFALSLYLLVMFVSALAGKDFNFSFWSSFAFGTGIITWLHFFIFSVLLASVFSEERDWQYVFRTLAVSSYSVALVAFLGVDGLGLPVFDYFFQGGSVFNNTSYNGAYLVLGFFIILAGLKVESRRDWQKFYLVSLVAIFLNPDLFNYDVLSLTIPLSNIVADPTLLFGFARTSSVVLWLGLAIALILLFFHKLKNKNQTLCFTSGLLIILGIIYIFGFISLLQGHGLLYEKYVSISGPARPIVWNMALEGIRERPFLGYGLENFIYVYQEHLDPRLIELEFGSRFGDVHNYTLSQFVETGALGALTVLTVFILVVWTSFRLYRIHSKYYLLLIPFIFFLHFLQLQTFFETFNTLFLLSILFAFLLHLEPLTRIRLPELGYRGFYQLGLLGVFTLLFTFFIYQPMQESRFIFNFLNRPDKVNSLILSQRLSNLRVDPVETLGIVSKNFSNFTARNHGVILEGNLTSSVAREFTIFLDTYRKLAPKYSDNYFFLLRYADFATSASVYGLPTLTEGEVAIHGALDISSAYPEPHLILALNLHYQGRTTEARESLNQAKPVNPDRKEVKELDALLRASYLRGDSPVHQPLIIDLFGF